MLQDSSGVLQQMHLAIAADFIRFCSSDISTCEEAFPGMKSLISGDDSERLTTSSMASTRSALQSLLKTAKDEVCCSVTPALQPVPEPLK